MYRVYFDSDHGGVYSWAAKTVEVKQSRQLAFHRRVLLRMKRTNVSRPAGSIRYLESSANCKISVASITCGFVNCTEADLCKTFDGHHRIRYEYIRPLP